MQFENEICIIPKTKWDSITNWLTEKHHEEERQERKKAYLKHLQQMSSELVQGNASKKEAAIKHIEEKRKKAKGKDQMILKDYLRIKENQKIERDQMMTKYQTQIIINKTPTLELTSALKEAQALAERQNEVELRKKLRKKEKDMEEKERYELERHWEIINILHKREEENRKGKLNAIKTEVWKQCQDNLKKKHEEYANQIKQEKMDLLRITEEQETKEKMKMEQQEANKRKTLAVMRKAVEETKHQRYIRKKQDQELYRINEVISNALTVRNCQIKAKIQEELKERVEKNVDLYAKYVSQLPSVVPSEETIYQNGVLENQDIYEKKMQEKRALKKKYADAKIHDHKEDIRRQKIKQEEEAELKRMEMRERYKKIEAMQYLEEAKQKSEIEQKNKYGKELLSQAEEQKNIKKHEKELEEEYIFYTYSKQDDRFVEYADEIIKFAKEKKWPTMPIRKVIENYKKRQPIMQTKKKEIPTGKHSALLMFQEKYINLPPEKEKQYTYHFGKSAETINRNSNE